MWLDPQKGLTNDNEVRDRGNLTRRRTSTPDEGVEREAQPTDEVGDEHHPLAWLGHGDDLALLRSSVNDVGWKVVGALQIFDVLVGDDGGLPLASRSRSRHD